MSTFIANENELEKIYSAISNKLFPLFYFHCGTTKAAEELLLDFIKNLSLNEKDFKTAQNGEKEILFLDSKHCEYYYIKKMRKKIKAEVAKKQNLPFDVSDELVSLLQLPSTIKTSVFFTCFLNYSISETAEILKTSQNSVKKALDKASSSSHLSAEQIKEVISVMQVGSSSLQRIFDKYLILASEKNFVRNYSISNFKRKLDLLIPFIALALIAFVIFCVLVVNNNLFA